MMKNKEMQVTNHEDCLVSVIIPVYNAANFLPRTIDSVLAQAYRNLEIILIDDESTDESPRICDEYAKKDNRIVVVHQKNSGTGPSRMLGVELSHGDYVTFVDNDDYIRPQMYETMVKNIVNHKADVCVCQWNFERTDGSHVFTDKNRNPKMLGEHSSYEWEAFLYRDVLPGSVNAWYHNGMVCLVWNKLYRRDLILGYTPSRDRAEDDELNDWVNHWNCKVVVIPEEFYIWCENFQSVSHQSFATKNLYTLEVIYKRVNRFSDDKYIVSESKKLYINMYIEYYFRAMSAKIEMPKHYSKYFGCLLTQSIIKHDISIKTIARCLFFLFSPSLYKSVFKVDL